MLFMDVSPSNVAGATFSIVKKGFDPDEVRNFLGQVSQSLSQATDHAATMEQRARQAVARMQQAEQAAVAAGAVPTAPLSTSLMSQAKIDDTETISRTLLLAQRTADACIADAKAEAEAARSAAQLEADGITLDSHRQAERFIADARHEARRAGENERVAADEELRQLLARLEFLREDVRQMDAHVAAQRDRLQAASVELAAIADGSLVETHPPVLSAASDEAVHATPVAAEVHSHLNANDETAMYNVLFTAPDADGRAPTPAMGYSTDESSVRGFRLPDVDDELHIDPVSGDDDDEVDDDDDVTAEVPIVAGSDDVTMKISGDDL
jgi:cell division septum initiation protein DivIVA